MKLPVVGGVTEQRVDGFLKVANYQIVEDAHTTVRTDVQYHFRVKVIPGNWETEIYEL